MSKMDELYERACRKLDTEAAQNAALCAIATHLKEQARGNIANCMAVLDAGKTLAGAYDAIKNEAHKRWEKDRKQEGVCITQDEAAPIIDAYYGIKHMQEAAAADEKPRDNVVSLFDMW